MTRNVLNTGPFKTMPGEEFSPGSQESCTSSIDIPGFP